MASDYWQSGFNPKEPNKLVIVTATLDRKKTEKYWSSWKLNANNKELEIVFVEGVYGVVPAFLEGIKQVIMSPSYNITNITENTIVACFHDDLKIYEYGWDYKVLDIFNKYTFPGIVGFGGAYGLGEEVIYRLPYHPNQLARQGFISNLRDAELHGARVETTQRVACFDGFSQIGYLNNMFKWFTEIDNLGIKHHFYDSMLGALSHRDGNNNYYLPISCHHAGGTTAVGSADYNEWARKQNPKGDEGFWEEAHRKGYEYLRGILPLNFK